MTEQIITMTGLEFTVEGRTVAYGAVIREGSGEGELLGAGARMGSLRPLAGCPTGRMAAALGGKQATAVFFGERFLLAAADEPRPQGVPAKPEPAAEGRRARLRRAALRAPLPALHRPAAVRSGGRMLNVTDG